jgi:hypothetical protein
MKEETREEETRNSNVIGKNKHHHPTKLDVRPGFRYFWAQSKDRSKALTTRIPDNANTAM